MKNFALQAVVLLMLSILFGSCSNEDEIDVELLISAPETLVINNENYVLNGFIADYGDRIVTVAELIKVNKTAIAPSIEIKKISLVKNDKVYQEPSPIKMDPTDTFTLMHKAEGLPSWTLEAEIQMVVEIKAGSEIFFIRDATIDK